VKLKTRVFELSNRKYRSLSELARAMGVSLAQIYRVRVGKRDIGEKFIIGAVKAFPGNKLDDLFYVAQGEEGKSGMTQRDEAVKLRESGLTYAEVGRKLGISKQRAWGIIKEKPEQKPAPDSNGMLTAREIARFLNVHINTVRRWSNRGMLKTYRIGSRGDRRFLREDVVAFLKKGRRN